LSIQLDGVNQLINLGALNSITQNRSFLSASIWIRPVSVSDSDPIFYFTRNGGLSSPRFMCDLRNVVGQQAVLRLRARVPDSGGTITITSPNLTVQSGQWQHIVAQIDCNGDSGELYSNGILDFSSAMAFTAASTTDLPSDEAYLGEDGPALFHFHGEMDDFRVYDRLLGPSEIEAIYTSKGHDGIINGLIARFQMMGSENSVVGTVPNVTGGRPGTPENSPIYTGGILSLRRRYLQGR
jgi:hypothetical protein